MVMLVRFKYCKLLHTWCQSLQGLPTQMISKCAWLGFNNKSIYAHELSPECCCFCLSIGLWDCIYIYLDISLKEPQTMTSKLI